MELKKKLSKETTVSAAIFMVIIVVVSVFFFHFNNSLHNIVIEAEPTQSAMEHMVQDVYRDNIILLEYLNADDYTSASSLDSKVKLSNQKCSQVENDIENLIITGAISNKELISDYERAFALHTKVEELRDQIIALHKEELATGKDLGKQKHALVQKHSVALDKAIEAFTSTAEAIELRNKVLKARILWQSKTYAWVVVTLIALFIIVTITKIKKITLEVIEPLDNTIKATKTFVEGDYESRVAPSKIFSEIFELQSTINKVFSIISKESTENIEKKNKIDVQLLKKEYVKILEYLKNNTQHHIKTNISDLKKHLKVTHPTVLERLDYLEKRGFIKSHKEGRERFLYVTEKF